MRHRDVFALFAVAGQARGQLWRPALFHDISSTCLSRAAPWTANVKAVASWPRVGRCHIPRAITHGLSVQGSVSPCWRPDRREDLFFHREDARTNFLFWLSFKASATAYLASQTLHAVDLQYIRKRVCPAVTPNIVVRADASPIEAAPGPIHFILRGQLTACAAIASSTARR